MEKPVTVTGNLCLRIQGYQRTQACVDPELKLVARVTAKSL